MIALPRQDRAAQDLLGIVMEYLFSDAPLWVLFVAVVLAAAAAVELGFQGGKARAKRNTNEKPESVSAMVGATLGLLAFSLAVTFGLAADRFDARRGTMQREANAIGTAYMRADLLTDGQRDRVRSLFKKYVAARLAWADSADEDALIRSEALHKELWEAARDAAREHPDLETTSLFVDSINDVIDAHEDRVMAREHGRVPQGVWMVLTLITVLAFGATGYHGGLVGTSRTPVVICVVLSFAVLITLIADLDRPNSGSVNATQQAMRDLYNSMD
ncbi:MAG: hypothetical protein IPP14_11155 [Planctomycetes bacterium]|nr:hypothetical protein [Planctomycetota bacterium]